MPWPIAFAVISVSLVGFLLIGLFVPDDVQGPALLTFAVIGFFVVNWVVRRFANRNVNPS
jgi:uncharacterized protein YneF (UPF0154 family)